MNQNIQKIFKNLKDIEPSQGIEGKILRSIASEKGWQAKKKLIFADALSLFSLGAFVFVLMNFWNGIANSQFWSLVRLAFTDTGIIAGHIGEFSISLLETLPAAHFAAILAPVFLLMVSFMIYFSNNHSKQYNH